MRTTMVDRRFGVAGERRGTSKSFWSVRKRRILCWPTVQHASLCRQRRITSASFDGDRGANTGGMGAFAPSPRMTPEVERRVLDDIVRPVLDGMQREGYPFRVDFCTSD